MRGLKGKRVVITAGASGIGHAMALAFHQQGARVAICDAHAELVDEVSQTFPDIIAKVADVTNPDQMQAFFDTVDTAFGGIDIAIANAGTGGPSASIEDVTLDDWRNCLAVSLDGAFLLCGWAAGHMKAQKSGSIILMSSTSGLFGTAMRSPYSTAKFGIIGLMKTLASELGPFGVRANAICPGAVEGPRMEQVLEKTAKATSVDVETIRQHYAKGVAMNTWVTANDVASAALFLCSDAAAKISGLAMPVDGHTESINL